MARVIHPPPLSTRFRMRRPKWGWVALAVAGLIAFILLTRVLSGPHFVKTIDLVNPTEYAIDITVSGATGGSMSLGVVGARTTLELRDVVDQGSVWRFALRSQGDDAGQLVLNRDQLRAQGWRVEIPASVGDRLRGLGVPVGPSF